jgi:hypothetical protein
MRPGWQTPMGGFDFDLRDAVIALDLNPDVVMDWAQGATADGNGEQWNIINALAIGVALERVRNKHQHDANKQNDEAKRPSE